MDIDFNTILNENEFYVEPSLNSVSGNRALINRFEIILMTNWRQYRYEGSDESVLDSFGGNAFNTASDVKNITDETSITASMSVVVQNTVDSIKLDEHDGIPDNERISSANISNVYVSGDTIYTDIDIKPIEKEDIINTNISIPIAKAN
jgi:hypothetical protein